MICLTIIRQKFRLTNWFSNCHKVLLKRKNWLQMISSQFAIPHKMLWGPLTLRWILNFGLAHCFSPLFSQNQKSKSQKVGDGGWESCKKNLIWRGGVYWRTPRPHPPPKKKEKKKKRKKILRGGAASKGVEGLLEGALEPTKTYVVTPLASFRSQYPF